MTIAMLASPAAWTPFQDFLRWFGPSGSVSQAASSVPLARHSGSPAFLRKRHVVRATPSALHRPQTCDQAQTRRQSALPMVRVVRVHEAGLPRANVGRMVISGRMADVCAELDRLVAKEAVLH